MGVRPYSRDSRSDAAEESKMQFGDFQTKVILHLAVLLLIVSLNFLLCYYSKVYLKKIFNIEDKDS